MTTIKELEQKIERAEKRLYNMKSKLRTLKEEEAKRVVEETRNNNTYEFEYHEYDLFDIGQQVHNKFLTKSEALDKIREGWPDKVTHHQKSVFDYVMSLSQDHHEDMAFYDIEFDDLGSGWYPHEGEQLEKDPNFLVFFS